jgi:hypothetical protein
MIACGTLIDPDKFNYSTKYQIFPTINVVSKSSLYTWFKLRECIMDFGKKYMMRVLIYSSAFLAFYAFYGGILLLSYF